MEGTCKSKSLKRVSYRLIAKCHWEKVKEHTNRKRAIRGWSYKSRENKPVVFRSKQ